VTAVSWRIRSEEDKIIYESCHFIRIQNSEKKNQNASRPQHKFRRPLPGPLHILLSESHFMSISLLPIRVTEHAHITFLHLISLIIFPDV